MSIVLTDFFIDKNDVTDVATVVLILFQLCYYAFLIFLDIGICELSHNYICKN